MDKAILLPYQRRWLEDRSLRKIWLASRQTGKSFALALEALSEACEKKSLNLLLSASERQSQELMQRVHMHMGYLNARSSGAISPLRETKEELELSNGSRIVCLPANPDTVRGFSGNVFLDEFAFHADSKEIWRSMYPSITRGHKVRVASTPNGKQNMFYKLWDKDTSFSKHKTTIVSAVEEGLRADIESLSTGIGEREAWEQEYMCEFLDEATAFITYGQIEACEHASALTNTLDFTGMELYAGVDIGRKKDLTVIWILESMGDVLWSRTVREFSNEPFKVQRDALYSILPHVKRCAIDATGIGSQLSEEAKDQFGHKVEQVVFTPVVKEDLALSLKRKFEERLLRIPHNANIREDLHSVKRSSTSSGNLRFSPEGSKDSHADRFWALALAVHACPAKADAGIIYEPVLKRRFTGNQSKGVY